MFVKRDGSRYSKEELCEILPSVKSLEYWSSLKIEVLSKEYGARTKEIDKLEDKISKLMERVENCHQQLAIHYLEQEWLENALERVHQERNMEFLIKEYQEKNEEKDED